MEGHLSTSITSITLPTSITMWALSIAEQPTYPPLLD
jgi:hypothetical protein